MTVPEYMRRILQALKGETRTILLQSKDPKWFGRWLDDLPENVLLGMTLETNLDRGYEKVSAAPLPSVRTRDFCRLDWPRKAVTIEPIMHFTQAGLVARMLDIRPERIWIGYNSTRHAAPIPEPPPYMVGWLIQELRKLRFDVTLKEMRGQEV